MEIGVWFQGDFFPREMVVSAAKRFCGEEEGRVSQSCLGAIGALADKYADDEEVYELAKKVARLKAEVWAEAKKREEEEHIKKMKSNPYYYREF